MACTVLPCNREGDLYGCWKSQGTSLLLEVGKMYANALREQVGDVTEMNKDGEQCASRKCRICSNV